MSRVQDPVQDPLDPPVQRSGDHSVRLGRRRGFLRHGGRRLYLPGGWDGAVHGRHGTVHRGCFRHHRQRHGSGVGNRTGDGIGLALNRRTRSGGYGPPTRDRHSRLARR